MKINTPLLKLIIQKKYVLVEKHISSIQDTLKFDSIVSFKYYEKSLRLFASSVFKGAKYGAAGSVIDVEIKFGIHWTILHSILYGSCGSIGRAIYGI